MRYDLALIEKPLDRGMELDDILQLSALVTNAVHTEMIPVEFQAEYSTAMGFIETGVAEEINYEYGEGSSLYDFVSSILNNTDLENETGKYDFESEYGKLSVYITR